MVPYRLLVVAIAAALVLPASAGAAPRATAPTPLSVAAAAGQRHWGAMPCGGRITFLTERQPVAGLDPASDAWVTFDSPLGANNLAAPAGTYTNCTVNLGRKRWPRIASMRADWDMFCATMIHELGHLLGHPHDSAAHSVMAPVFTDHSFVPPICRTTRPPR